MNTHLITLIFLGVLLCIPANAIEADSLLRKAQNILYNNPAQAHLYAAKIISDPVTATKRQLQTEAYVVLGTAQILQGDFDGSVNSYFLALDNCPAGNIQLMADVKLCLSNVYISLKDFQKAMEYNDRATAYYKSLNDSTGIGKAYNSRGLIHLNLMEDAIAERFFKQSLDIHKQLGNKKMIAANLNNLSLYKGDTDEKIQFVREAIQLNEELKAEWSLGENYNNLGRQFYYAGRYDEALSALAKAYEIAEKIGAKELICDNYEYLAMIYEARKEYAKAYSNLQNLYKTASQLQNNKNLRNIEREISEKRLLRQKVAAERQEQEYQIHLLRTNLVIALTLMFLLLLAAFFRAKWYKHKKNMQIMQTRCQLEQIERENMELKMQRQQTVMNRLEHELDDHKQELINFAMYLRSRDEVLNKIREQIKECYKLEPQENVVRLKRINAFISQHQNLNNQHVELFDKIEEKNKAFLQRLTLVHPHLTRGEKYLATLVRVNLSTKEISLLTGSLPKTVTMNRYRLRKSLELVSEADLCEYLRSI